jgi:opacity protein-like surface antigen
VILLVSALGLALLLSPPADAQIVGRDAIKPYVFLTGGLSFVSDLDGFTVAPAPTPKVRTENAPNGTIGGGFGATQGYLRYEIRADYHRSRVDTVDARLGPGNRDPEKPLEPGAFDPQGETLGVTTILYKMALRHTFFDDRLAINAGVGIGAAYGKIPIRGATIRDWEFGYSVGAGVFYEIWNGIGAELGYRYVGATDFSEVYQLKPLGPPAPGDLDAFNQTDRRVRYTVAWRANEIILSLRYTWGGRD